MATMLILKRAEKMRPAPAAALEVIGDLRELAEGVDEGSEAAGLLDAAMDGCSAPVPRVSIEKYLAWVSIDRASSDLGLIPPKIEQKAHTPSRQGSASSKSSESDNDRHEECSALGTRSAVLLSRSSESDNDRHEERSPVKRADCWDVRWGAAVGALPEGLRADCWDVRWGAAVGARTKGQPPDARSLCEQRVRVHVMRLFSI